MFGEGGASVVSASRVCLAGLSRGSVSRVCRSGLAVGGAWGSLTPVRTSFPGRTLSLALIAAWTAACVAEDEDPLSQEALQRVARAQGDAEGQELSANYVVGGDAQGCDCPEIEGLDLCGILSIDAPVLPAAVSHYDGLVVIEISGTISLIGGVWSDGSFAVASILDAGVIGTGGEILSLVEGTFDEEGFVGEMVNRFSGAYLGEAIDCRGTSELTGLRSPP